MVKTIHEVMIVKKDYIFYGAFGIGVVALVAVLAIYNLRSQNSTSDEGVDLNASNQEIAQEEGNLEVINEDDIEADDRQTDETDSDADKKQASEEPKETKTTDEKTDEDEEDKENEETSETNETKSDKSRSNLSYNGAQTLTWPVTGDVILPYSMETTVYFQTLEQYKCNPGMLIGVEAGEQVAAVYAGEVTEIGESKEFGQYLILDLGNGYEVYYGQLKGIHVSEGDSVSAGDKIASVAEPTSYYEQEGCHLYIKITKDGTPLNPVNLMTD